MEDQESLQSRTGICLETKRERTKYSGCKIKTTFAYSEVKERAVISSIQDMFQVLLEKELLIILFFASFTGSISDVQISLLPIELLSLNFTLLLVSLTETSNVPNPTFCSSLGALVLC